MCVHTPDPDPTKQSINQSSNSNRLAATHRPRLESINTHSARAIRHPEQATPGAASHLTFFELHRRHATRVLSFPRCRFLCWSSGLSMVFSVWEIYLLFLLTWRAKMPGQQGVLNVLLSRFFFPFPFFSLFFLFRSVSFAPPPHSFWALSTVMACLLLGSPCLTPPRFLSSPFFLC